MAIITSHPDITTTASKVINVDNVRRFVMIHAHQGGVYIGNSGVTSDTGYLLDSDDKVQLELQEGEDSKFLFDVQSSNKQQFKGVKPGESGEGFGEFALATHGTGPRRRSHLRQHDAPQIRSQPVSSSSGEAVGTPPPR
jgi:hypothetical protein